MTDDMDEWARVLAEYTPELPAQKWAEISPFVLETAAAVAGRVPYRPRRVLRALVVLARTCLDQGWGLDRDEVFQRELLDYAVSCRVTSLSRSSQATVRPILLRVGEALRVQTVPVRLVKLPAAAPSRPYSATEIGHFRAWADGQRGEWQSDALALLIMGAAGGLTASEILQVRVRDIASSSGGYSVAVPGPRGRVVPLLRSWNLALEAVLSVRSEDQWFFRPGSDSHHPNYVGNFIGRSRDCGHGRPQIQRLRATWLVTHLSAGTHTVSLLRAAGVDSLQALTRYLPFAQEPSPDQAEQRLRDAS